MLGNAIGLGVVGVTGELHASKPSLRTGISNVTGQSESRPSLQGQRWESSWTSSSMPLSTSASSPLMTEPLSPRTSVLGGGSGSRGSPRKISKELHSDIDTWDRSREALPHSIDLYRTRSMSGLNSDAASVRSKKRGGGFMSKLLRKTASRSDLREDSNSFGGSPSQQHAMTMPLPSQSVFLSPKLQPRGEIFSSYPSSPSSTRSKQTKRRKPTTPTRAQFNTASTPGKLYGFDPSDSEFGSMEGIVNFTTTPLQLNGYDERSFLTSRPSDASGYPFPPQHGSFDSTGGASWASPSRQRETSAVSVASTPSEPVSPTRRLNRMDSNTSFLLPSISDDSSLRRPSTGVLNPSLPLPVTADMYGNWKAPDSWAVKGDRLTRADGDDETEEEEEEEEEVEEEIKSTLGHRRSIDSDDEEKVVTVRKLHHQHYRDEEGRPVATKVIARTAASDSSLRAGAQKNSMIRIHRHDATFSTLTAPSTVTAADLVTTLGRKFQANNGTLQRYALFIRERGIERRMAPNEKPIMIQKRRLEQAGYTEVDKFDDLGREDNSYLCRLVYKPIPPVRQSADDDPGESVEFIDLGAAHIETIPIPLYKFADQIVSLNLSRNRPFDLPTDFVQSCSSLRELVLSHMGLKRVPAAVKECRNLTRLDLSNNHMVDLEHVELDLLSDLTSLKCHNNRLWSLPAYFSQFRTLKYLNLSNNRFESFPQVTCDIVSLVELDASFNTITSLPPEIGQLVELERLFLVANAISLLPPTLRQLTRLRELDCRRNALSDLSHISAIASIEVLRLEYNQASVLDADLKHLRKLNASHNSVTRFALAGTSTSLTSLNISNAKLASLAVDMFDHLGSVEHLTFDSNQIRVLPDGVGSLANLVTLSMKNNLLDELPASIGRLQRLQSLQLSGNNLPALPSTIWHCSQLTVLNATSNLLADFPDPPATPTHSEPAIDELDMRKLSAVSKTGSTTSRIAAPLALSLQKLYLGDNRLGEDAFVPISLMTELRVLNLSFNRLFEIPATGLRHFQQLEELYLSGNKLNTLPPEDLARLINLKLLYCNGNKLQTLPSELGQLKNLLALDVGNNVLKYNISNWPYDWNWNYNTELRYLNLSGNKRLQIKSTLSESHHHAPRYVAEPTKNLSYFFSLARLHVLGLMDVTLRTTLPEENEDRRVRTSLSTINEMAYGIADTLGSKAEVLSLLDIVHPRFRAKDDEAIFGLFDAVSTSHHSGAKLVKYLQNGFPAALGLELSRLKNVEVIADALRRAFLGMNRDYGNLILSATESKRKGSDISVSESRSSVGRLGAAGIVVYIRKKRMYVANAGNALAVMAGRNGTARLVAKKHDPFDATEVERVRRAEGWISHRGAVNDEVEVSRSFGFYSSFPAVNAAPNVGEVELTDTDEFVIIANTGLWEHMSYQVAVDVARTERNDPMAAAAKLRDLAISYGSAQNVMVMVVCVGDLFKAKKDYRSHRSHGPADFALDSTFYGQQRAGVMSRRGLRPEDVGDRSLQLLNREIEPPVGQLALVFTDIRNSTALWESNPGMQTAIRMHNQLLRRHLRAIGGYEVKTEGDAFMTSFSSLPAALLWCLTVQMELLREDWPQEILDSEEGREIVNDRGELMYRGLSVRMGVHWGAPLCEADPVTRRMDYFGSMVNRSSRIQSVAAGGQIAVSQDVIDILQDVVVEHKRNTLSVCSKSGSDTGSDDEETEEWLDQSEKQDVLALRRIGFGYSDLGERRLKGLETPEKIYLFWPKALKDRNTAKAKVSTEVHEPSTQLLDHQLIVDLGRACQRLETAAGLIAHPERFHDAPGPASGISASGPGHRDSKLALAKRKTLTNPMSLSFAGIRPDSTDDELVVALEHFVVRVEHALSTLVLHQLGPFAEVLSALGGALQTDPRYVMNALGRFSAMMGAQK